LLQIILKLLLILISEKLYLGFGVPSFPPGVPSLSSVPQIVGGEEAPEGAYPYVASLQWGLFKTSHFCAGSIIKEQWILTAGHCILAVPSIGQFKVKAGKHNLKTSESTEQVVEVAKTVVHEEYNG